MTTYSDALDTALAAPVVRMFAALEIVLPEHTLRLLDGAGTATIGEHVFTGRDATYGVWANASEYGDGLDDEAPNVTITLMPPSNTAMAAIAAPEAQGSAVTIWTGVLDAATGTVVDVAPEFYGELDVPTQTVRQNGRELTITVVSAFERFFAGDEGARLNNGFHQSVWPGELGLQFVSAVQQPQPWGNDSPRPVLAMAPAATFAPGVVYDWYPEG